MKPLHNGIPAFAGMTSKFRHLIILFTIILFGGFLRFYSINWDNFGAFHPDERNISWAVTRIYFFSQMDPKFFAYGGLPIYLYRAIGEAVVRVTHDTTWLYDWGHIAIIGRSVSAVLSTISIGVIFLVGAAYFSPAVGLTSAFLLAVSPWAIREAHFETTETMLVFFLLLLLYFSKKYLRIGSTRLAGRQVGLLVVLGIIWGLALAAKTTAVLFGVIPAIALLALPINQKAFKNKIIHSLWEKLIRAAILSGTTVAIFFLFSPFTILDFNHFYESMTYESGVALGRFTVPYTLQFWHTPPYLYQLITMLWQAGPLVIVGLAGLTAMVIAVILSLSKDLRKTKTDSILRGNDINTKILFLIFPLVYFGWVGNWFAKFARYNVPFLPFITIAAAWLMVASLNRFGRFRVLPYICLLVYSIICLLTLTWGLANWTVYLRPQTKSIATEWIVNHIPATAKIYTEHWNDGLPLDLPGGVPTYNRELLTVYDEPDNDTKRIYYADKLAVGDYIILSTRRIWATMPRLTEKYPVTSLFYKKLLAGDLGYKEVATFTSYPQLLGVHMNDDMAEESLQVFDHPTVRIFKNTAHYSEPELLQLLQN